MIFENYTHLIKIEGKHDLDEYFRPKLTLNHASLIDQEVKSCDR
jgi:hypothetical protein